MNRDEVLNVLRAQKATLVQRFGVVDLALFGSNRPATKLRTTAMWTF